MKSFSFLGLGADMNLPLLTDDERAVYQWQMWIAGLGEQGQRRLKAASVLVSRIGGVGGTVALQLAAAGVGRLVLAHAGRLRPDDLNRQLLMSHAGLGTARVEQAARRLHELNPRLLIEAVPENISEANAHDLVGRVDAVASCAPLFEERLLMNREAVKQRKPLVDCAMYEMEAQLLTVRPGNTACLACLYPEPSTVWKRKFPVLGAVAGTVACLGAVELIKLLAGLREPLTNEMLVCDLADMEFRKVAVKRRPNCPVCGEETSA
jgi:molybdopterin/thiamine biosynthesis adenylyltransferase